VFTLFDMDGYRTVDSATMLDALAAVGLDPVPQLGTLELRHSVDELVAFSVGPSALNPKVQREGIVLRPPAEELDPEIGGRLSFKVINPQFLLKYDE
jgi:hypothetical protein